MSQRKPYHVPDMALHRRELEQQARDQFTFLLRDKGFTRGPTERTVWATAEHYLQTREQIGVEVEIDFRDETVRVYLLKVLDGKLPQNGFVANGERIRIAFLSLLRDVLGVEDEQVEALFHLLTAEENRNYQFASDVLARWHDIVECYIDIVSHQPLAVLFPAPPPNASRASQA